MHEFGETNQGAHDAPAEHHEGDESTGGNPGGPGRRRYEDVAANEQNAAIDEGLDWVNDGLCDVGDAAGIETRLACLSNARVPFLVAQLFDCERLDRAHPVHGLDQHRALRFSAIMRRAKTRRIAGRNARTTKATTAEAASTIHASVALIQNRKGSSATRVNRSRNVPTSLPVKKLRMLKIWRDLARRLAGRVAFEEIDGQREQAPEDVQCQSRVDSRRGDFDDFAPGVPKKRFIGLLRE